MLPLFAQLVLLLAIASLASFGSPVFAEVLKGRVQEKGQTQQAAPSLSRTDLNQAGETAGGLPANLPPLDAAPMLDAPKDAFKFDIPKTSGLGFGLNATNNNFAGLPMLGTPDTNASGHLTPGTAQPDASGHLMPGTAQPAASGQHNTAQNPLKNQDPEADLGWDQWHRRVAQAIFQRWNEMCSTAFHNNPFPMQAYVGYTVTKEGQIKDVQLLRKSPNPIYDALVLQVVSSFNGDKQLLQFPEGSHRLYIEKFGEFNQNIRTGAGFGAAFRYTTGDKEHIQLH